MARTKKIGLKSTHNIARPAASPQLPIATSNQSRPALPVAIELTSNTKVLAKTDEKSESTSCLNKKTHGMDSIVNAQFTMPQAGKSKARSIIATILTLSVGIGSNSNSGEISSAGQKTSFLDLPLELRAMIYKHALAVDNDTYEVAHVACSGWSEIEHRHNFHRVTNIKPNHFALLTVNHQVANEVKATVPAKSFKFTSTYALDNFLFCEEHEVLRLMMANFNVLCKASRIVVIVGKRPFSSAICDHCVQLYDTMTELLPKPLDLEFVDAENSDQRIELVCILFACTLATTQRLTSACSTMPDVLENVEKEKESHAVAASHSIGSSVQRNNVRSLHLYHDSQVYSFKLGIVGIAQASKFRYGKEEATRIEQEEKVKARGEEKNFRSKGRRKLNADRAGVLSSKKSLCIVSGGRTPLDYLHGSD